MEVPRPAVPSDRLAGWRETDATIDKAFSTPIVTVYTHTVVFEETEAREQIRAQTGCDHPWQFFFVSRIRLEPRRDPNPMLTQLVRRKAAAGFTDRLADRGIEQVAERNRRKQSIGEATGQIVTYGGLVRRSIQVDADNDPPAADDGDIDVATDNIDSDDADIDVATDDIDSDDADTGAATDDDRSTALLAVPITAVVGIWAAAGDYHVAGGGVPAGPPDSGPPAVVDAVAETIDPTAARETLLDLIDACGQAG
ncbi:hypothetical protein [Halonotius roseus]|uniref:Uncharacterized protein n=1 Tax=Halonotius roseus TaxID=2511997 RepID=A0A544QPS5_9EURY|nr:hypothetical protein [Halonotius roseus]TQQ81454.1 hypothetical protein EWF95_00460 [Halonotius roseus]